MTNQEVFDDFFEGAEKRISIATTTNLDSIDMSTWSKWINKIGCTVLSVINNDKYVFFLLSESSCLVGKNYVMIKTCGKTKPLLFLDNVCRSENIDFSSFKYSHPDLLKPEQQESPYDDINSELNLLLQYDVKYNKVNRWLCCQYGKNHENFYELICWKFDWPEGVHIELKQIILNYFSNATLDDKCFDPCGYSLNMLDNMSYMTIHVTPQKSCSYLSIESNDKISLDLFDDMIKLLNVKDYEIHTPENYNFSKQFVTLS